MLFRGETKAQNSSRARSVETRVGFHQGSLTQGFLSSPHFPPLWYRVVIAVSLLCSVWLASWFVNVPWAQEPYLLCSSVSPAPSTAYSYYERKNDQLYSHSCSLKPVLPHIWLLTQFLIAGKPHMFVDYERVSERYISYESSSFPPSQEMLRTGEGTRA